MANFSAQPARLQAGYAQPGHPGAAVGVVLLAGAIAAGASATAALALTRPLAGSVAAQASAAGNLYVGTVLVLAGAIAAQAGASGALTVIGAPPSLWRLGSAAPPRLFVPDPP